MRTSVTTLDTSQTAPSGFKGEFMWNVGVEMAQTQVPMAPTEGDDEQLVGAEQESRHSPKAVRVQRPTSTVSAIDFVILYSRHAKKVWTETAMRPCASNELNPSSIHAVDARCKRGLRRAQVVR
jgi:hypothetical protein